MSNHCLPPSKAKSQHQKQWPHLSNRGQRGLMFANTSRVLHFDYSMWLGAGFVTLFSVLLPLLGSYLLWCKQTWDNNEIFVVVFFTHIQFVLWVWSGCLVLHPRSRPGTPGRTGSPRTGCGHRVGPAAGPPSPDDNSHSTSTEHRIQQNILWCTMQTSCKGKRGKALCHRELSRNSAL